MGEDVDSHGRPRSAARALSGASALTYLKLFILLKT